MANDEIRPWSLLRTTLPRPRLVIASSATPDELLAALELGLTAHGFKVKERGTGHVRLRNVGWFGMVFAATGAGTFGWTNLDVRVATDADGSARAVVDGSEEGDFTKGRQRAAAGLTEALRSLRTHGFTTTASAWESAPR